MLLIPSYTLVAATGTAMLPDGCTATTKFSATTGHACEYIMVADCNPGDVFSSFTGKQCPATVLQNVQKAQQQVQSQQACIGATDAKAITDDAYKNSKNMSLNDQASMALKKQIADSSYYGLCYGIYTSSIPTALCNDYTYSYSLTHSGSCSYHGGVLVFLQ